MNLNHLKRRLKLCPIGFVQTCSFYLLFTSQHYSNLFMGAVTKKFSKITEISKESVEGNIMIVSALMKGLVMSFSKYIIK